MLENFMSESCGGSEGASSSKNLYLYIGIVQIST